MTPGLDMIFPEMPLQLGAHRLMLRPVVLSELPKVQRVIDGWRHLIANGGASMDGLAWLDFCDLIAAACGKDLDFLTKLDTDQFDELASWVLAINEKLWKGDDAKPNATEFSWAMAVQCLISHGHTLDSVSRLTLAQLEAYLIASAKEDRERLAMAIQAEAFSMADPKSIKSALKELRNGHP